MPIICMVSVNLSLPTLGSTVPGAPWLHLEHMRSSQATSASLSASRLRSPTRPPWQTPGHKAKHHHLWHNNCGIMQRCSLLFNSSQHSQNTQGKLSTALEWVPHFFSMRLGPQQQCRYIASTLAGVQVIGSHTPLQCCSWPRRTGRNENNNKVVT